MDVVRPESTCHEREGRGPPRLIITGRFRPDVITVSAEARAMAAVLRDPPRLDGLARWATYGQRPQHRATAGRRSGTPNRFLTRLRRSCWRLMRVSGLRHGYWRRCCTRCASDARGASTWVNS